MVDKEFGIRKMYLHLQYGTPILKPMSEFIRNIS